MIHKFTSMSFEWTHKYFIRISTKVFVHFDDFLDKNNDNLNDYPFILKFS